MLGQGRNENPLAGFRFVSRGFASSNIGEPIVVPHVGYVLKHLHGNSDTDTWSGPTN